MTTRAVERTLVLLSLQRAMLGEVFPSLRRITVEWSDHMVKFVTYVDGPLQDDDEESLRRARLQGQGRRTFFIVLS
jgi:hypothetical protein